MRYVATPILMAGFLLPVAPAEAQTYAPGYPVCMEAYTIDGRSISCAFVSMAQCAATASGLGATCYPNPYAAPARPAGPSASRPKRRAT